MSYQSLYRRYRPRRFSDVRGQEQVVRALRNAVRDDRVGHAYLFSGPRGTGKTSTARILAKALNCENLQDGEPDGTCESCLAIDAGTSYDVQELDAASNNGVENVRDLVGRANLGSPGRTKVYILDEVHMLTAAASAALLKTLEEPPDHVVFVLATTDPHKVLATIRSRTQHYEFLLLSADELAEHVAWVIHDAGLGLDPDVIDPVVRAGAGSARDTLSALDRVAAAGGVIDTGSSVDELVDAIASGDSGAALVAVATAMETGRDARVLGEEVLARLRDVFLLRMGAGTDHVPAGDLERVRVWADQLGDRSTTRALEAVGDALLEMRQAPDPRIPLEVAMVKLTRIDGDASVDALVERISRLEAQVAAFAAGGIPASAPAGGSVPTAPASATVPSPAAGPSARPRADQTSSSPSAAGSAAGPAASDSTPPSAPPAAPRGRPADAARAELAAKRAAKASGSKPPPRPGHSPAAETTAAAPPAPSGAPPAPPSTSPSSRGGASTADTPPPAPGAPVDAPTPSPAPTPEPTTPSSPEPTPGSPASSGSSPAHAPGAATGSGGGVTLDRVTELWADLPGLSGLTKGMFAAGTVVSADGGEVVVAVPNEVHRQKCEQKKGDVEAALTTALGASVTLRLVADGGGAGGSGGPADQPSGPRRPPADETFADLGVEDVRDLPDAPDAAVGGVDALTEAFPGATFVEGS